MDITRALEILHWFQKFRRGAITYAQLMQHCTTAEIGTAIDVAIKSMRLLRRLGKIADNLIKS